MYNKKYSVLAGRSPGFIEWAPLQPISNAHQGTYYEKRHTIVFGRNDTRTALEPK